MDLKQFDELLHDAEVKLKRLKALYEQWFQGIERIEPLIARKDLDRSLSILSKEKPRNTAARFRLTQLTARYAIYTTYWQRIARQIEEGSFVRDVRRAHQMYAGPKGVKAYKMDLEEDIDLSNEDLGADEIAGILSELEAREAKPAAPLKPALSAFSPFAKKPADAAQAKPAEAPKPLGVAPNKLPAPPAVPKPAPASVPKPAAPIVRAEPAAPLELSLDSELPPPPSPQQARKPVAATFGKPKPAPPPAPQPKDDLRPLYERFVDARRKNNEPIDNVGYEKIKDSVEKIRTNLRAKHGDKKIDFEVVVQDGKVAIKPKIE